MNWNLGAYWDRPSLIWGEPAGQGDVLANVSPLGYELQTLRQLSSQEIEKLFSPGEARPFDLTHAVACLAELFSRHQLELLSALRGTTAFNKKDCEETLEGCISLLERCETKASHAPNGYSHGGRSIGTTDVPWGTVLSILPQNAFLIMGITSLIAALAGGNRVILRVPTASGWLGAIFGKLLLEAGFDPSLFSIVLADAGQIVEAWERAEDTVLLHYMGSSGRAGELLTKSFQASQPCLIDGEGNAWAYVDAYQDASLMAETVWKGAIRYNGQTCTSVNGVVVHPSIEADFRTRLRELASSTTFGLDENDAVGPLFTKRQAQAAENAIKDSGGRIGRAGNLSHNMLPPTLVEDPDPESDLVREGLFGPAMWVRSGDFAEFKRLWRLNRYPLCAAVFGDKTTEAITLRGASRIVLNGDPSLEDPMEPWGGYPPCGSNPVSAWIPKYQRAVQIDQPG